MKKKSKIVTAVMAGVMCGISTGNGRSFFDSSVSRVCVKKGEKYEKVKFNDYCYCVFYDIILLLCSKQ